MNRYLSRLWVRSFSFLGIVIDTVMRFPEVGKFVGDSFMGITCHTMMSMLPSPSMRKRMDMAATCQVASGN